MCMETICGNSVAGNKVYKECERYITNNVYMCIQHVDGIDNVCLCKHCMEAKLYIIGSIKSSRDDI